MIGTRCRSPIASWPSGSTRSSRPPRPSSRRRPGTHAVLGQGDGKIVCFFKSAAKFDSKYATLGFEEAANLDDGAMWATSFALTEITDAEATRIAELVKQAVS